MAGYRYHLFFGFFISGIVGVLSLKLNILNFSYLDKILIIPIILIYSILPDIDIASSKIRKIFMIIGLSSLLAVIWFNYKSLSISITLILLLLQFIKHRKFIHSISAGLIFSAPLIIFSWIIALIAFICYISHLLVDGKLKYTWLF